MKPCRKLRSVYKGSCKTCCLRRCHWKLLASPCLCGKLQNLWFSTLWKCQNWNISGTKCSFLGSHTSPLESLAFLWLRRVYKRSYTTFLSRGCQCLKIGRSLARNARFQAPHMSRLESLASLSLRRVYGGSYKTIPFRSCQSFKIERILARYARCPDPTCLRYSLWLSSSLECRVYRVGCQV